MQREQACQDGRQGGARGHVTPYNAQSTEEETVDEAIKGGSNVGTGKG